MIYELILTFWLLLGIVGLYFGTQGYYGIGFGFTLLIGFAVFEFISLIGRNTLSQNQGKKLKEKGE